MGPNSLPTDGVFCFEAVEEEAERPKTALDVQRASRSYLSGVADLKRMGEADDSAQSDDEMLSKIIYVCTSCGDAFEELTAWDTHEKSAHERQYYWACIHPTCAKVFSRADKFENHHQQTHGCVNCTHADDAARRLPPKKAWGCGFDMCHGIFENWEQRCAHVAGHYEGFAALRQSENRYPHWRYTNMIRNLLRQPDIKDRFRSHMIRCHGESMVTWPRLQWKPNDSGDLKRQLEYGNYRNNIEETIELAYQLGLPTKSGQRREERKKSTSRSERPAHKRSAPSLSLFPPRESSLENVLAVASGQEPAELPPNPAVRPLESRPSTPSKFTAQGADRPLPLRSRTSSTLSSHRTISSPSRSRPPPVHVPINSQTPSIIVDAPTSNQLSSGPIDRSSASSLVAAATASSDNIAAGDKAQSLGTSTFASSELVYPYEASLNATDVYLIHRPTNPLPLPLPSPTLSQFPSPPGMGEKILQRAKSMVRRDKY